MCRGAAVDKVWESGRVGGGGGGGGRRGKITSAKEMWLDGESPGEMHVIIHE